MFFSISHLRRDYMIEQYSCLYYMGGSFEKAIQHVSEITKFGWATVQMKNHCIKPV